MDYDSPDWDRTPTESIEVKEETPHLIKTEAEEPSTSWPKTGTHEKGRRLPTAGSHALPSGQRSTGQNLYHVYNTTSQSPSSLSHIIPQPIYTQHTTDQPQANTNTA